MWRLLKVESLFDEPRLQKVAACCKIRIIIIQRDSLPVYAEPKETEAMHKSSSHLQAAV